MIRHSITMLITFSLLGCASLRRPAEACNAIGHATDAITNAYLATVAWPETPRSVRESVEDATKAAAVAHDFCFADGEP